ERVSHALNKCELFLDDGMGQAVGSVARGTFVDESAPSRQVPAIARPHVARHRHRVASSRYITPPGCRVVQQELSRLLRDERPRVTREVAAAAPHGGPAE